MWSQTTPTRSALIFAWEPWDVETTLVHVSDHIIRNLQLHSSANVTMAYTVQCIRNINTASCCQAFNFVYNTNCITINSHQKKKNHKLWWLQLNWLFIGTSTGRHCTDRKTGPWWITSRQSCMALTHIFDNHAVTWHDYLTINYQESSPPADRR